jgi:hypothetical protein
LCVVKAHASRIWFARWGSFISPLEYSFSVSFAYLLSILTSNLAENLEVKDEYYPVRFLLVLGDQYLSKPVQKVKVGVATAKDAMLISSVTLIILQKFKFI